MNITAVMAGSGIAFLILFHEFGHWLAARCLGMQTLVFSVGFGGKRTSIRIGKFWQTEFRLGFLPFGGYVLIPELHDEETGRIVLEENGLDGDTYQAHPAWKKAIVMAAGPGANLVLAYLIYAVLLSQHRHLPPLEAIITAITTTGSALASMIGGLAMLLHLIPVDPALPAGATNLHGVVGIFQVMQNAAGQSSFIFWQILAYLSLNLTVLNMLPLPMLDGGQLAILAIEKMTGKSISVSTRASLSVIALMLIAGLTIVGIFNDLAHPIAL
jgi:regulator of sigma E protease